MIELCSNLFENIRFPHLGLLKLLHVACQIPEQCEYPVTAETRQHLAICLQRLYDDMVFDTKRKIFSERLDEFYKYENFVRCSNDATVK